MNLLTPNFLIEGMRLVSRCAFCRSEEGTKRHLLEADDQTCSVYVYCPSCHGAMVALMHGHDVGVSCVGIMTDLSRQEAYRWLQKTQKGITSDDVLAVHEALTQPGFLQGFQQKSVPERVVSAPNASS